MHKAVFGLLAHKYDGFQKVLHEILRDLVLNIFSRDKYLWCQKNGKTGKRIKLYKMENNMYLKFDFSICIFRHHFKPRFGSPK